MEITWNRDAMRELGKDVAKKKSASTKPIFDRLHRSHAGKPMEEVLIEVRKVMKLAGLRMSEEHMRNFAKAISDGLKVEPVPGEPLI